MRFEILDEHGAVQRTVIADETVVERIYPGMWRQAEDQGSAEPRMLTRLKFRNRFTMDEKVAIYTAAESIDLSDPATISGVQALEDAGILAEGRAVEVLA